MSQSTEYWMATVLVTDGECYASGAPRSNPGKKLERRLIVEAAAIESDSSDNLNLLMKSDFADYRHTDSLQIPCVKPGIHPRY